MDNNHLHHHYLHLSVTDQQTVQSIHECFTYVDDEEVEPAPVVGEVLLEAVREPLEQHLQDEDVGENTIGILQNDLYRLPLLNVHILKGLKSSRESFY